MNTKTRNFIISGGLIILSILITILITILIKYVDVSIIGPDDSSVGFATLNEFVFKVIGINMIWYNPSLTLDKKNYVNKKTNEFNYLLVFFLTFLKIRCKI